jgi:hypothetical protein
MKKLSPAVRHACYSYNQGVLTGGGRSSTIDLLVLTRSGQFLILLKQLLFHIKVDSPNNITRELILKGRVSTVDLLILTSSDQLLKNSAILKRRLTVLSPTFQ